MGDLSRKWGTYSIAHFIPINDFSSIERVRVNLAMNGFEDPPLLWAMVKDLKQHRVNGRFAPAIVLPDLMDEVFHLTMEGLLSIGYRPHWFVIEDRETHKYYFGDFPAFSRSFDPNERRKSEGMPLVDIEALASM